MTSTASQMPGLAGKRRNLARHTGSLRVHSMIETRTLGITSNMKREFQRHEIFLIQAQLKQMVVLRY